MSELGSMWPDLVLPSLPSCTPCENKTEYKPTERQRMIRQFMEACEAYAKSKPAPKPCTLCGSKRGHFSRCSIFNHNKTRTQFERAPMGPENHEQPKPQPPVTHPRELNLDDFALLAENQRVADAVAQAKVTDEVRKECEEELRKGQRAGWKWRE